MSILFLTTLTAGLSISFVDLHSKTDGKIYNSLKKKSFYSSAIKWGTELEVSGCYSRGRKSRVHNSIRYVSCDLFSKLDD